MSPCSFPDDSDRKQFYQAIDLSSPCSIPESLFARLALFEEILREVDYLEQLSGNCDFQSFLQEMQDYLNEQRIFCYHFTRANAESIRLSGLLALPGDQFREQFLSTNKDAFTLDEVAAITSSWSSYFDDRAREARDRVIWFTFIMKEFDEGGIQNLIASMEGNRFTSP